MSELAKTVILIIASSGFQPQEYLKTHDALIAAGITVLTASDQLGTAVASDSTTKVAVDLTIDKIDISKITGLFLIGGPGALDHLDTLVVKTLFQNFVKTGKSYGAICISPRILAQAGFLRGKKATGWNNDQKLEAIFEQYGVVADLENPVVVDGVVVTANGPKAATDFGKAIVGVVKNAS